MRHGLFKHHDIWSYEYRAVILTNRQLMVIDLGPFIRGPYIIRVCIRAVLFAAYGNV